MSLVNKRYIKSEHMRNELIDFAGLLEGCRLFINDILRVINDDNEQRASSFFRFPIDVISSIQVPRSGR